MGSVTVDMQGMKKKISDDDDPEMQAEVDKENEILQKKKNQLKIPPYMGLTT